MVAYQADVLFWFLGQQLFIDLHSTVDRKLVNNKVLLQHLIATPTLQNIFVNFPAGRIFIFHGSLGFHVICQSVQLRNAVLCLL